MQGLEQFRMDGLMLLLHGDFSSMGICHETLASVLVSLRMVAERYVNAIKSLEWENLTSKPM